MSPRSPKVAQTRRVESPLAIRNPKRRPEKRKGGVVPTRHVERYEEPRRLHSLFPSYTPRQLPLPEANPRSKLLAFSRIYQPLSLHRLRENAKGTYGTLAAGPSHEAKPPGGFGAVCVLKMGSGPMKALGIPKAPRNQGKCGDPGAPIVIERMKWPIGQLGRGSGICPDCRAKERLGRSKGKWRDGGNSIEPFIAFACKTPSIKNCCVAATATNHPERKRSSSDVHGRPPEGLSKSAFSVMPSGADSASFRNSLSRPIRPDGPKPR